MNFKQIETFRAVMLSGSMTLAASALNTSQPNVSRQMARLEDEVGFKLFLRQTGRLQPTPEAHEFFREVVRAFTGLKSLERSAQSILKQGTGHLRIGSVPSLLLTLVPAALQAFSHEFPDVQITVCSSDSFTVTQWTATGYCDIGLVSHAVDNPRVVAQMAGEMDGVCIVPVGHRLAVGEGPICADDLRGEKFISLLEDDATRRRIDAAFADCDREPRILAYNCHYGEAICHMVSLGMGVSIVRPTIARRCLHLGIVIRSFRPRISFFSFLLRPVQSPEGRLAQRFAELFSKIQHNEIAPEGQVVQG